MGKPTILTILLMLSIFSTQSFSTFAEYKVKELDYIAEYTSHEPIYIVNNNNFTDYGFPGSGTESEPYIIDGFSITTEEDYGIKITDTSKYFVLQNCYVDSGYYGIVVGSTAPGTVLIQNNICENSNDGIIVYESDDARIVNNYCAHNYRYSIWIYESKNLVVEENICVNNSALHISPNAIDCTIQNNELIDEGLSVFENNVEIMYTYNIVNNLVNGKKLGYFVNLQNEEFNLPTYGQLYFVNCVNIEIYNQNLDDTTTGVLFRNCRDSDVHHVSCVGSGIEVYNSSEISVSNTNCSNAGWGIYCLESENIDILSNICTRNIYGIFIRYSENVLVKENICSQGNTGIWIDFSDYVNVIQNECNDNRWEGIDLGSSEFAYVYQNICINNTNGIQVIGDNAIILNNICMRNQDPWGYDYSYWHLYGFGIIVRSVYSYVQIQKNYCSENKYGIGVSWGTNGLISHNFCSDNVYGLHLEDISNYEITNNTIYRNNENGLKVIGFHGDTWWGPSNSTDNEIVFNNICNNTLYGITLDNQCTDNLIHFNNFFYNGLFLNSQAEDNGTDNFWVSNFWTDLDSSTYSIDGVTESIDLTPLYESIDIEVEEITIPTITIPIVTTKKSNFQFSFAFIFVLFIYILNVKKKEGKFLSIRCKKMSEILYSV